MRKLFALVLTLCLLASTLCVTAFATEPPAAGVVLRISGQMKGGDQVVVIKDSNNFKNGWNDAMDQAQKAKKNGYDRIIVDLYADWTAVGGEFSSDLRGGAGFAWDTILFPANVHVTLNMNGHTIDRAMTTWEYNGEVMCVDPNADVIINNGTIKGGYSCNGAGGIHIQDDANLVLNNVNVVGNHVDDDDGAAIAVYDGASLTMNGGSISNNISHGSTYAVYGGGVYVEDAKATFKDVTFENNESKKRATHGGVVYADNSTLVMENCKVIGNGKEGIGAYTIIHITNTSHATMKNTKFLNNGIGYEAQVNLNTVGYTSVIHSTASYITMEKCTFTDNNQVYLITSEASRWDVTDSFFTGNNSFAFFGNSASAYNSTFTNCRFGYNEPMLGLKHTFFFNINCPTLSFVDCDFGEATFNDPSRANFVKTEGKQEDPTDPPAETTPDEDPSGETMPAEDPNGEIIPVETPEGEDPPVGTILASGSVPMVVALAALAASAAALVIALKSRKETAKTESEE